MIHDAILQDSLNGFSFIIHTNFENINCLNIEINLKLNRFEFF